jgi:hypothetical protein
MTRSIFLYDRESALGLEARGPRQLLAKEKLSALIDQGRLFIPNEAADAFGQEDPWPSRVTAHRSSAP